MKARNGNTLTFSDTAIASNTGKTVTIARDPAGHITAITDPRLNSVKYAYDINGNLVSVTDRMNDPATQYQYTDPNHPHYLSNVIDPLGVQQLHATFDTTGRLTQMTDAKGYPLNLSYNVSAQTQTVTDPNLPSGSQTATVGFDARGNPLNVTDPTGAQSSATFNNSQAAAKDLPDTVTQTRRNPDNTTTSFTTHVGYDANGQVTSTTNPTGAVTRVTYGPFGEVQTVSDPLGNTVTNTYDTNGNLSSTLSAAGVVTSYKYDPNNNLAAIIQGSVASPFAPSSQGATTKFAYDSFGYLATSTTPTQVTTSYSYDANGNSKGSSFNWLNPVPPFDTRTVTTSAVFDANDRQTQSIDVYAHAAVTKYDLKGRVYETDDVLTNATHYVLDARDQVVQTSYPDGTLADTVYDAEGRVSYTDDAHVPGQADVHGTHTIYDSMARVTETDRLDNLVLSVTQSGGVWSSQYISNGVLLSKTTSSYNDLGQVTQSMDAATQPTEHQYDAAGRQVSVTDALQETTSTGYDAAGRTATSTDALGHMTQYAYDGDGKTLKTTFADGSFTQGAYDSQGRQTSTTDQMGRTTQ